MIEILLILLMIILLSLSLYFNDLSSPISIFVLYWFAMIVVYELRLVKLYRLSEYTFVLIVLGIFCFWIGYLIDKFFFSKIKFNMRNKNDDYAIKNNTIKNYREKAIIAIYIISILAILPMLLPQLKNIIAGGTFVGNKEILVLDQLESNNVLWQYFSRPLLLTNTLMGALLLFKPLKKKYIIIFLQIVLLTGNFIISGSKGSIMQYAFAILFCYLFYRKEQSISIPQRVKRWAKCLFALATFSILLYMSFNTNVFASLYTYFCGCIPLFDQVVATFNGSNLFFTYGFVSLHGIFRLIAKGASLVGLPLWDEQLKAGLHYMGLMEYRTSIGDGVYYNSLATVFHSFYFDFGVVGIIIGMFVFGFIASHIYSKFKDNKNSITWGFLYLVVMYFIVNSEARFMMYSVVVVMAIIYGLIMSRIIVDKNDKYFSNRNSKS